MCRDNVPTQLVRCWPLNCELFDGDVMAGPVRNDTALFQR
jgi:hypothetical protein